MESSQRFWSKTLADYTGCVLWQAAKTHNGYGHFYYQGKYVRAHRFAWFLAYGNWSSVNLLHKCDNPACVRVAHLREGTSQENTADMVTKGRLVTGEKLPQAKLTEAQAVEIRWRATVEPRSKLAKEFGVTTTAIDKIAWCLRWRHAG